ncbi:MAG: hypothetical protein MR900_01840 [Prevotella sp.]|nr:hypothetical protein [Prevotella sp.]MDY5686508.1 hypothetical protein [Prevotella sp.]
MDEKIERIDKPVWLGYTLYAFVPVCMRCRAAALPAVRLVVAAEQCERQRSE